jgi:hydroxyacylglutathione hydrolase
VPHSNVALFATLEWGFSHEITQVNDPDHHETGCPISRARFAREVGIFRFSLATQDSQLAAIYNETMIHEILPVGPLQCNCSIIGDETTHEAMVIDPGDNIDEVLALIRKHNLQVKQIVITHAHIDHVGGAMKLRAATGAPILLNQNDYALLKMLDVQATWIGVADPGKVEIDRSISTGETVTAGQHTAQILHTPGHTEGSICLYFEAEKKLIAGDTLFAGSIGRTDLPGGSTQKIMRSLHDTVLALPDETVVVPGHGESTTIGEERETNPFLVKR